MAEGTTQWRSFKDSISKASGDADEIFCEPCINRGKSIAVEGYCKICQEYMCQNCLEVHKNQKMTRNHTILDKTQMPTTQGAAASQGLCTEVCETHHPEIIRFYCKAHDVPGCGDCITLNHATCKKERVQDISEGFQATKEFKQITQKLDMFYKDLETIKDTLEDDLNNINTAFNNIQQNITNFRQQINDYLDKMQKQLTEEAEQLKKDRETEMNRMIAENESMKSEVEGIMHKLQNDPNVNTVFVLTKQANQRLITMENELQKMNQTESHEQHYAFRSSSEIEIMISAKTPLGKLVRKPNINTTVSYRGDINVKSTDDQECFINELTLLTPDRMVITDAFNKNIKLIDINTNAIVSSYSTSSIPRVIAAVSEHQVAVSFHEKRHIELFHVTSKLTKQRQIRVNCSENDDFGFAYKDGKFVVSNTESNRIEIIDMHGNVLHRLQPKMGESHFLNGCFNVLFGHGNDTVIASDFRTNMVSVISFEGEILQTYTHDALKDPCGIELTADGVLYVCSSKNGCVHAVSPDFKTSKIIIDNDNNVVVPGSIAYCDVNHRLYVVNGIGLGDMRNNSLQVYDLSV